MMHIISTEEKFKIFRAAYGHIYWKIAHYYGRVLFEFGESMAHWTTELDSFLKLIEAGLIQEL